MLVQSGVEKKVLYKTRVLQLYSAACGSCRRIQRFTYDWL